jgi:hypothetical protein
MSPSTSLDIPFEVQKLWCAVLGLNQSRLAKQSRTLSPNLLSPNLCGALDTVHGLPSRGCGD